MKNFLRRVTNNWFVFFGYFALFLLTIIAALQIYDANYKITGKYKELAIKDNVELSLLLKSRENLEAIQAITVDKVFHPSAVTSEEDQKWNALENEMSNELLSNGKFNENANESNTFKKLQRAWNFNQQTSKIFISLQNSHDEAIAYYRSVQRRSYEDVQNSISSLSRVLTRQNQLEEAEADEYFRKSIGFINILIAIRVAIIIIIGIIIFKVVDRLRSKNKMLQRTQAKLLQNQAHLLASQHISKTGSWELILTGADQVKNTLTWSNETYRIFGYEPGEVAVTGDLFLSHVEESDQMLIKEAFLKSIEEGIPFAIEHKVVLKNGESKIVYERSDIFYDAHGKPEKMIGTCQDITELKLAEQKLTEAEIEKHRLRDEINRQKINRQREITKATIKAQEMERLELGRELHDNVNQILSTSKLFIENSMHNPEKRDEMLNRSKTLINTSIEELRRLSRLLAPPSLGDLTLKESIEEIVEEYNHIDGKKVISRQITDLDEDKLTDDLKISVYRIIQEQLNNIRKHAHASKVRILLKHGTQQISLSIEDNGCGFDVHAKRKGLGITNIINRAETFNGDVHIISSTGKGCAMYINFKLGSASIVSMPNLDDGREQKLYGTGS